MAGKDEYSKNPLLFHNTDNNAADANNGVEGNTDDKTANNTGAGTGTGTGAETGAGTGAGTTPAQPNGLADVDVYKILTEQAAANAPESDKDKKKRLRREKWEGVISGISDVASSLSNLYFTTKGAPNMYDGTHTLSAAAKERREKAKAERDAKYEKHINYALKLKQLKDADEERAYQRQRDAAAQELEREKFEWQKGQAEQTQKNWLANYDLEKTKFNESVRQFNTTSERQQQQLKLEAERLALQRKQGEVHFNLGHGKGNVKLSSSQLNAETVSRIFRTLPQSVRDNVHGQPIYTEDRFGNKVISGYSDPSTEAMLIAIGANVQDSPETQDAIREVAGQKLPKRNIDGF